jgi:hypothetical protein
MDPNAMRRLRWLAPLAASLAFPFHEVKDGLLVRESAVGRNADAIVMQVLDAKAPRDGELDLTDRGPADASDYNYVRLPQINGAHAWTSPVWVGGEAR